MEFLWEKAIMEKLSMNFIAFPTQKQNALKNLS